MDRTGQDRQYREGLARQLNQAQCGQEAWTDCHLNPQTRGTVCRLHSTKILTEQETRSKHFWCRAACPEPDQETSGTGGLSTTGSSQTWNFFRQTNTFQLAPPDFSASWMDFLWPAFQDEVPFSYADFSRCFEVAFLPDFKGRFFNCRIPFE